MKQMAAASGTDASLGLALTAAALSATITVKWMQWRQQKGDDNVSKCVVVPRAASIT